MRVTTTTNDDVNRAMRRAVYGDALEQDAEPEKPLRNFGSWDGGARRSPPPGPPSMNAILRATLVDGRRRILEEAPLWEDRR
jgi:hypothetical protein